ncbi:T9SS type A sorting domain-containing protein [Mucilaginibacter gracilis]|uniref:T9SS type A sorting domain-containing protein n=1 Tax=Mucilaginibacter gracilis TaxID=423350 RepID=UPI001FE89D21|nr:T9SS type A sorting domain-containing protein [Mucilaginibacter gracilis]
MLIIFSYPYLLNGQVNYVQNPSFEQYSKCPYDWDQIKFANNWSPIDTINHPPIDSFGSGNCTPEYCNICAGANRRTGIPYNDAFYQYPRTGNGMAQVYMFADTTNIPTFPYLRDYLQGKLYKPLISGKTYCVSFYVNLEESSGYAVNHIGAYFDGGQIDSSSADYCGYPHTKNIPQVFSTAVINDTANWVKVEGSFVANGTEKYITIGNFFDQAHTTHVPSNTGSGFSDAYYLVDDVSVVESDAPAFAGRDTTIVAGDSVFIGRNEILPGVQWSLKSRDSGGGWVLIDTLQAGFWVKPAIGTNTYMVKQTLCGMVKYDTVTITVRRVGINELNSLPNNWHIYPNPAKNEIRVVNVGNTSNAALAIYDLSGRLLLQQPLKFDHGNAKVPLNLVPGVYIVHFSNSDEREQIERLVIY